MRRRRRSPQGGHDLEVTPFINLMVVLVAFFLGSAAFFSASILRLNIPPGDGGVSAAPLQLEIIIRKDSLEVSNRRVGPIQSVSNRDGAYDYKGLNEVMKQIKARYPDTTDATVLADPETPYQVLVDVMDAVRIFTVVSAGSVRRGDLFPNVSLGDAPRSAS